MGCDGGSIPKRKEIVKNKRKDESVDKQVYLTAKWHFCALSGLPLHKPIVSCQLGRLYNKDAILQYLIDRKVSNNQPGPSDRKSESISSHIKSLKDVTELELKDR